MIRPLTPRQAEVLALLAEGYTTQQIATRLYIAPATVRNHVQEIMERLDVHTRLAAVARANGLPTSDHPLTVMVTVNASGADPQQLAWRAREPAPGQDRPPTGRTDPPTRT